jgi:hypothetical protein
MRYDDEINKKANKIRERIAMNESDMQFLRNELYWFANTIEDKIKYE